MNRMKYIIKQDPDALDLSNRPQHLLSPSIDNEDDDEYYHSEDEQQNDNIQETSDFVIKVYCFFFLAFKSLLIYYFRNQPMIVVLSIQVMRIMS
jgi:hypothetical protein